MPSTPLLPPQDNNMAAQTPLRVGLIGAGANTKLRHLPGLRDNEGVTVTHGTEWCNTFGHVSWPLLLLSPHAFFSLFLFNCLTLYIQTAYAPSSCVPHNVPSDAAPLLRIVVNRSPESSAAAAAALEIPNVAASWKELVNSPDIDAVCIGTWPYTHAEMTIAALKAGKHVL